ncbi:hypothetical protein [Paraburkholderia sp. SIMBA_054]|uniref:hypothetical protein n=1 Tax=Paraburkholderia sp. SIMBA_054 TaxID=3085795 RepID=UPI00397B5EC8
MRVQKPQLPSAPSSDKFGADLVFKVKQIFGNVIDQLNNLSEGHVAAATNASTAPPTAGTYQQGDFIRNSAPSELGTAGSKYVITGWLCTAAGTPGTWVACRSLTGN